MNQSQFNKYVKKFENAKDKNGQSLEMHSFGVIDKENTFVHRFKNHTGKSDVRSISKTVMTLLVGIVNKQDPEFNEETDVYPLIKDVVDLESEDNLNYLNQLKVKHLLTHTIGYDDILLMRQDIKDTDPYKLIDLLVNHPIVHKPGEHYLYSNAGMYMLSCVLQEYLNEDLFEFAKREFFNKLDITDVEWEYYGSYLAGATRLWLHPEDLLKIGVLLLDEGQGFMTKEWFDKMTSLRFTTPTADTSSRIFRRYGYGYGIWLNNTNIYFGHGTAGQTLVVLPEQETVLITQAELKNVDKEEAIINELVEAIVQ